MEEREEHIGSGNLHSSLILPSTAHGALGRPAPFQAINQRLSPVPSSCPTFIFHDCSQEMLFYPGILPSFSLAGKDAWSLLGVMRHREGADPFLKTLRGGKGPRSLPLLKLPICYEIKKHQNRNNKTLIYSQVLVFHKWLLLTTTIKLHLGTMSKVSVWDLLWIWGLWQNGPPALLS